MSTTCSARAGGGRAGDRSRRQHQHPRSGFTIWDRVAGRRRASKRWPDFCCSGLGYIPAPGESVTYGPRTFIVQEMDRNRIARVKIVSARPTEGVAS